MQPGTLRQPLLAMFVLGLVGSGPAHAAGAITAVWANDGGNKVTQDELRAKTGLRPIVSSIWDGRRIRLFGARNEVIGFNLVLEAAGGEARNVSVQLDRLAGPQGSLIRSTPVLGQEAVFDWTQRDIELFLVGYLQIRGLSRLSYETYDERHIPERLQRPRNKSGDYVGGWRDRPGSDKYYPEIAVPLELKPSFSIAAGKNQSVWVDIYIPKDAPSGLFTGNLAVREGANTRYTLPVELEVRNFTLSDLPSSRTMIALGESDIARRYTGIFYPASGSSADRLLKKVVDRHYLLAHRHKLSLIDGDLNLYAATKDAPPSEWIPRLSGRLFTATNGYRGPGSGVGNNVYAIGPFGTWQAAWGTSRASIWARTNNWESWFRQYFPDVYRFVYLIDESSDYRRIETWAGWIKNNPGVGRSLRSFATGNLLELQRHVPSLDIAASWIATGDRLPWQTVVDRVRSDRSKSLYMYNGTRPGSGSFATEDDGTALRQLPWGQHKKGIGRWFFWQGTYYNDYQGGRGETNLFKTAQTFGGPARFDLVAGMTGWSSSNGDGVLFYPGIDKVFPTESLGLAGPIASLRLKHWRRGVQDVDYIKLAEAIDPAAVRAIVQRMVPKALWENGVDEPADPTWVLCSISWSIDSDDWEAARRELAGIIERRR
jgi:Domain of unknown function (DUF4091)